MQCVKKGNRIKLLATCFRSYKLPAEVEIDANLLFNRLVVLAAHEQDVKGCVAYELTSYPAKILFKEGSMYKPDKPYLLSACSSGLTNAQLPSGVIFVVDGECLLHHVRWGKGLTVLGIMEAFKWYVLSHFEATAPIVFDSYSDEVQQRMKNIVVE